jgi:hypothetical protein
MFMLETPPDPRAKSRRLAWMVLSGVVVLALLAWWSFRFYPEKKAAEKFFDAVVAGDMARAYQIWKPAPSYTMQDFLADWGPNGYYGPVKSYEIVKASLPRGGSGVIVSVNISPFAPLPPANDIEKHRRTRTVSVWVESKDKSFTFPP